MKSFEEIAGVWLESEIFGKQYSYRKGIEKDFEHLINYFGTRNCEEIKGMDVDKCIQYETEYVNPNTGNSPRTIAHGNRHRQGSMDGESACQRSGLVLIKLAKK